MGRVPRWRMGKKGVCHVYNRGINSAWILSSPEDREFFRQLLVDQRKNFKIEIYHYVIMKEIFLPRVVCVLATRNSKQAFNLCPVD